LSTPAEPDTVPQVPGQGADREYSPIFPKTTIVPGAVALLLGILGLAGMYFGIAAFRSIYPGYQTMAFSTGSLLILFGAILAAGAIRPFGRLARDIIQAAMVSLIAIEAIELPFNIGGSHFLIESLTIRIGNTIAGQPTSSISPVAIFLVIFSAAGIFLLVRTAPGDTRTMDSAGILGLIVALSGFTVFLSYLFGVPLMYGSGLVPVAAPTALAFVAVGTGLVTAAGTGSVPLRYFSGDSIRAHLLRTFLPLTIVVILAGTALELVRRVFGGTFNAIITAASIVVFSLIAGFFVYRASNRVGSALDAANRERQKAEEDLRVKNTELEASYEELTATEEELRQNYDELAKSQEILQKSEARLRLSSAYNRSLLEASLDPLVTISPDGTISDVNAATVKATGIGRESLIGTDFSRYFTEPDRAKAGYETVFREGAVQDYALEIRHVDGRVTPVMYNASVFRDETGMVNGVFAAARDITVQKRAEEALQEAHDELEERVEQRTAELEIKNEELTATQEELQKNIVELGKRERDLGRALAEKEVLLSEIHHRVKNNLTAFISLLSLEGSIEDTPAGKTLRQDLQNRARSMSLIHETLYRTKLYDEIDMGMYLTMLLDHIGNSFRATGSPVKTVVDAHGVMLDISRATPAGLIVNELVTNSYKYAFSESFASGEVRAGPPTISVALAKVEGEYQMTVKDNGPGLPPGFDIAKTQTLGLKLVNFLAKHQMQAKVEVNSDNGTEFIFRFGI
jgi:PAS domain S-box-containing protein